MRASADRWGTPAREALWYGVALIAAFLSLLALAGCESSEPTGASETSAEQLFPDVVAVDVIPEGSTYTFRVTISSPYDTPARYADGWRIKGMDGTVYAEHTLAHDHAGEQPFTRTQSEVQIPPAVHEVVVEGRDLVYGYGGRTQSTPLP